MTTTMTATKTSTITFNNKHDAPLTACLFQPDIDPSAITTAILLAPATGIQQGFYAAFASYLAEQGFAVLTFNNEGIGDSLTGNIKNCHASLVSWGKYDMTAVLECLKSKIPHAKYHLIGHSAGGQLFGLMDNYTDLTSVFNVACSSGQIKNMKMPYKAKAMWFMDFFIPTSNLVFGYAKTDKIGMGEPLPKRVAQQWRKWCNGSGYIATDFGKAVKNHYYDKITTPSLWINAPDDDIANDANVADMIRVFPNIQASTKTLIPQDYGLQDIGHMKFFSRKSQILWKIAVDWIKQNA